MCFLIPRKVQKIQGKKALLSNGLWALMDPQAGIIKEGDEVLVFGNLIIGHAHEKSK
jgi:hypothetical protein